MYVCRFFFLELLIWAFWPVQAGLLPQECQGHFSWSSAGTVVVLLEVVDCYVREVVLFGCVTGLAGCHGQC